MTIDREALREKVARAMAERDNWVWDKLSDEPQPWDDYNEGKNWWRDKADAALSALDQPAQEPAATIDTIIHTSTGLDFERRPDPQPATLPDDLSVAISQLRALCNDKIRKINQGRGVKTEGFRDINDLLKACDKVFATLPDESQ